MLPKQVSIPTGDDVYMQHIQVTRQFPHLSQAVLHPLLRLSIPIHRLGLGHRQTAGKIIQNEASWVTLRKDCPHPCGPFSMVDACLMGLYYSTKL